MPTLQDKAAHFLDLHRQPGAFIIPNPWDVGTARILARTGFKALATTSAGFAFSIGLRDSTVSRGDMLNHVRQIAGATDLHVSADLESGFGSTLELVDETFRLAGETGIVGGSIEDSTGVPGAPIFDVALASERVQAAVASVRRLPFHFTLTARCENFLHGRKDLSDTISRLQKYQEAGADVLYAPGLIASDDIATVVRSVDRPVNVLAGLDGMVLSAAQLSDLGVKRISVGSALSKAALGTFVGAAREMMAAGTFDFAKSALSSRDANAMFDP